MSDLIKEVLMGKLFGSGTGSGGSSGSGGGGSSGGGTAAVSPKEVNFYDYDGTCVHAYTVAEAQALSELPAGPEHPGLVFQGWNWSLEGVKGLTRAMNIGAMYTTDDGTTRLYITLQEGRTSPMLGVGVNGTVTVDWGDGTEPDALTGTSASTAKWTPNHAYAAPGDYVIRLTVDGAMSFLGSYSLSGILRNSPKSPTVDYAYLDSVRKIEIGDNVSSIGAHGFHSCKALECLNVPRTLTGVGENAFNECVSLRFLTVPPGITSGSGNAMSNCYSLKNVAFNENTTVLPDYFMSGAYSLAAVTIPKAVKLGGLLTSYAYLLERCTLPDDLTSVPNSFSSYATSMTSISIPASVNSVGSGAFSNWKSMAYYDFTACISVPSLGGTSAFTGIPADCEIRVPAALYDEWIAATNWATYASYIKAY